MGHGYVWYIDKDNKRNHTRILNRFTLATQTRAHTNTLLRKQTHPKIKGFVYFCLSGDSEEYFEIDM